MKTLLVTTPIRPVPTTFPPFGSLSILRALAKRGVSDVEFYNIDANRPTYEETLAHIRSVKPRLLAISAVVSTAYAYTRQLTLDVKEMLPDVLIVIGGSLAASAEILLRRTGVDICVAGEGELALYNIVERAQTTVRPEDFADIPGLVFLDPKGEVVNTGYEAPLAKEEIYDVDWDDLARGSDIDMFIHGAFENNEAAVHWFRTDPRTYEPHRRSKKVGHLPGAKGCVARCTFCHRWDKGIRYIPVDLIMQRLEELIQRYNVGFLSVVDENFGTDRRWLTEFCEKIAGYDILWHVAGMRVNCISPEYIALMKSAGCSSIIYGMESGSERMLKIMEKKVKVQDNYNALKWTLEADLRTVVQLVIGMPGESPDTIKETIEFVKYAASISQEHDPNFISINYAQALPGTPLYEYARKKKLIGQSLDEEESYLELISNRDAHDEYMTLNFTDYPTLICRSWRPRIQIETNYAYVKKYGLEAYRQIMMTSSDLFKWPEKDTGYFANPKRLVDKSMTSDRIHETKEIHALDEEGKLPSLWSLLKEAKFGLAQICYPVLFYRLRYFLVLMILLREWRRYGLQYTLPLVAEYLSYRIAFVKRKVFTGEYKSLRKIVDHDLDKVDGDVLAMAPLRKGR